MHIPCSSIPRVGWAVVVVFFNPVGDSCIDIGLISICGICKLSNLHNLRFHDYQ